MATAQWLVDGLHPTHLHPSEQKRSPGAPVRDETAKDGAPAWFWLCEEEKGNSRSLRDDNQKGNGKSKMRGFFPFG